MAFWCVRRIPTRSIRISTGRWPGLAPPSKKNSVPIAAKEAERAGVAYRELFLSLLAIDVDVADDIRAILACETLGRRTREALSRLEHAR